MKSVNKFSKKADCLRVKPTKKCSTLAEHGFGAPLGIVHNQIRALNLWLQMTSLCLKALQQVKNFPIQKQDFLRKNFKKKKLKNNPQLML